MKSLIVLICLLFCSAVTMAQPSSTKPAETGSRVDEATTTRNKLVYKTTYDIGNFGQYLSTIKFEGMVISIGSAKVFGLRAAYMKSDEEGPVVSLDLDEIRGMIDALQQIRSALPATTVGPGEYTEAKYSSRSGAEVGFYKTSQGDHKCYFQVASTRSMVFFDASRIDGLITILQNGIDKLTALGAK